VPHNHNGTQHHHPAPRKISAPAASLLLQQQHMQHALAAAQGLHGQIWQQGYHSAELPLIAPVCLEVLPASASEKGGVKACVIGRGFLSCGQISLRFGTLTVPAVVHDDNCLIFHTPPHKRGVVPMRLIAERAPTAPEKLSILPLFFRFT
jgi:hypothetical protein